MILIPVLLLVMMLIFLLCFVLSAAIYGLYIGMRDEWAKRHGSKTCRVCKEYGWVWKDKPDYGLPRWVVCDCKKDK